MKRRLLLSAIANCAGAALLLSCVPLTAAQYGRKVVRLGLVGASSSAMAPKTLSAFWDRLRELGYVEGDNLIVLVDWRAPRAADEDTAIVPEWAGATLIVSKRWE